MSGNGLGKAYTSCKHNMSVEETAGNISFGGSYNNNSVNTGGMYDDEYVNMRMTGEGFQLFFFFLFFLLFSIHQGNKLESNSFHIS